MGISRNKQADKAAKEAAQGRGEHEIISFSAAPYIRLATTARKAVRDRVRAR